MQEWSNSSDRKNIHIHCWEITRVQRDRLKIYKYSNAWDCVWRWEATEREYLDKFENSTYMTNDGLFTDIKQFIEAYMHEDDILYFMPKEDEVSNDEGSPG